MSTKNPGAGFGRDDSQSAPRVSKQAKGLQKREDASPGCNGKLLVTAERRAKHTRSGAQPHLKQGKLVAYAFPGKPEEQKPELENYWGARVAHGWTERF